MRIPLLVFAFVVGGFAIDAAARQGGAAVAVSSEQAQEFLKGSYPADTPGLIKPVMKREVKPRYSPEALREKIEGSVELQAIIDETGRVARVRVTKSLDREFGLDEQAVAAAKQWTFEPGQLGGKAVPVAVALILEFRLH